MVRYNARLVVHVFSQRSGINYEKMYSPVMDMITFYYLINMTVKERLDMCLMDVITIYLYGKLDNDIYMKILRGLKIPKMGAH